MVFGFLLGLILGVTLTCIVTKCMCSRDRPKSAKGIELQKTPIRAKKNKYTKYGCRQEVPSSILHQIVGAGGMQPKLPKGNIATCVRRYHRSIVVLPKGAVSECSVLCYLPARIATSECSVLRELRDGVRILGGRQRVRGLQDEGEVIPLVPI